MKVHGLFWMLALSITAAQRDNAWAGSAYSGTTEAPKSEAAELNQEDADAYVLRSAVKMDKGDLDGAIADSTKAIELNPADADAYVLRSAAKIAKGDLDGAIADGTKAIQLNSQNADAYVNRGIAKKAKGDLDG